MLDSDSNTTQPEYMTVSEARERLGIAKQTMTNWLRDGILPFQPSPFNKRAKMVRRVDVERLAMRPRPTKKRAA